MGDCVKILLLIFTIETLMSDSSDCNVGFFDGQDCVGNKQINVRLAVGMLVEDIRRHHLNIRG